MKKKKKLIWQSPIGWYKTWTLHSIFIKFGLLQSVAALRIFLRVFFKKHKLYNLIKKEIHILTTTTIKKKYANT